MIKFNISKYDELKFLSFIHLTNLILRIIE